MITWITVLCNSRKLWAIPCRATQEGQVTVDSSEKTWSTGEGNGKPSWSWRSNTLATWCEEPTLWKRPWCWERLKAGEVDDRGWDGWMASLTQWTWVWAGSGRWWRTGKPGMLQSMGFPRVGYNLETEQQKMLWAEWCPLNFCIFKSYPSHSPVLQNVTLWGDMVFKEDIKLKWGL